MGNEEVLIFTGGPPPSWLESHSWYAPVRVAPAERMPMVGLKRLELSMAMCCMKCAEIISEKLREVPGVLDVQVDFVLKKVIVIGAPFPADVLRRAKRIDRKAHWWPAPPPKETPKVEVKEEKKVEVKEEKKVEIKEEKKVEVKEEKKEEKKEETKEEKKEEKKEEEKKEETKEEKKEEAKEEKKAEEKKEDDKEKPKLEEPKLQQYPPFEYMVQQFPSYDYHPSQAYNPLLPYHPYPHSRQVFYDWPHFRTAEGAEAAFVPPPKPVPYENIADLWNIFRTP